MLAPHLVRVADDRAGNSVVTETSRSRQRTVEDHRSVDSSRATRHPLQENSELNETALGAVAGEALCERDAMVYEDTCCFKALAWAAACWSMS